MILNSTTKKKTYFKQEILHLIFVLSFFIFIVLILKYIYILIK